MTDEQRLIRYEKIVAEDERIGLTHFQLHFSPADIRWLVKQARLVEQLKEDLDNYR